MKRDCSLVNPLRKKCKSVLVVSGVVGRKSGRA